jgi:hypothetical protein
MLLKHLTTHTIVTVLCAKCLRSIQKDTALSRVVSMVLGSLSRVVPMVLESLSRVVQTVFRSLSPLSGSMPYGVSALGGLSDEEVQYKVHRLGRHLFYE